MSGNGGKQHFGGDPELFRTTRIVKNHSYRPLRRISDATFYNWKAKHGGREVNEARRLRRLEEENGRLKKIVAERALDFDALKVVLSKK